jgi:hypothetical protein
MTAGISNERNYVNKKNGAVIIFLQFDPARLCGEKRFGLFKVMNYKKLY